MVLYVHIDHDLTFMLYYIFQIRVLNRLSIMQSLANDQDDSHRFEPQQSTFTISGMIKPIVTGSSLNIVHSQLVNDQADVNMLFVI